MKGAEILSCIPTLLGAPGDAGGVKPLVEVDVPDPLAGDVPCPGQGKEQGQEQEQESQGGTADPMVHSAGTLCRGFLVTTVAGAGARARAITARLSSHPITAWEPRQLTEG